MEPLPDLDLALDTDRPVLRQVQFGGRRYAISIEPAYWRILEEAARTRGVRLNQLVQTIAAAPHGPGNLAARLRLYCLRRQSRLVQAAENTPRSVDLAQIVDACPVPCFAVSREYTIVWHNPAFRKWLELDPADLAGMPFARHFRLRLSRPLPEVWQGFATLSAGNEAGTLTCLLPGRLLARPVSVCPVPLPAPGAFVCLVFVR